MIQELEKIKIILENIINEEEWDLSEEEKKKLKTYFNKLKEFVDDYKNIKLVGSFKNGDEYVKKITSEGSYFRKEIEKIKRNTKEGMTEKEYETLKAWDACEKALTFIQNKMANSNIAIDKAKKEGNSINSKYTGKELRKNIDWNTLKEETNYFPY